MPYSLVIKIDCTVPVKVGNFKSKFPPSLNHRLHWAQRSRLNKIWRMKVNRSIGLKQPRKPLEKCFAIITKYGTRDCDFDNLVTSMKAVIDGLTDAGIMVDDSTKHFSCEYKFEKCKRNDECLVIQVMETA
jgi:Holliday junction resolvase RusA-like endonuclease